MSLFEIKHRYSGEILFSLETKSLKLCVEASVKAGANLADAYLADANLADAYLAGANLADAYLADANLTRANLAGSILESRMTVYEWAKKNALPMRTIDNRTLLMAWRTQNQPHMRGENYEIGKLYTAEPFSMCPVTSCHPGRYIDTQGDMAVALWLDEALLAGSGDDAKVRCKRFYTVGLKAAHDCDRIFNDLQPDVLEA